MKPILFNTEMVKAILEDRKTVTRRLVKNISIYHEHIEKSVREPYERYTLFEIHKGEEDYDFFFSGPIDNISHDECILGYAPYQVGEVLYVRETWCDWTDDCGHNYFYKSTDDGADGFSPKWHPSIHMSKEAARIFLKVTDVRLERLQDIDDRGCAHEGIVVSSLEPYFYELYIPRFKNLWDSTVKEYWQKWESNPYVWVIEFERCEKPEVAHED